MKTSHRCWAEIDLDALRENLSWIRHRVGPTVKILTVVKADAYGHGLKQIAALLMQSGTDIFGVANLEEARSIRSVGRGWPVLMLGACLPDEVESVVRDDVRPTISSVAEARSFSRAAAKVNKTVAVHLKVNTGMGRLGIEASHTRAAINTISKLPGLQLEGLYTHYASAEDDAQFSREQGARFKKLVDELTRSEVRIPLLHANNSAALLHEPSTIFNLVRPGLLVYGVLPKGQRTDTSILQKYFRPVLSLKCRVALVREISRRTSLSYGRTFVASRRMRVAVLTAGYGDGYLRANSNRAEVLIRGQRCRVLGRVTMDQTLVDVSRLKSVACGEEVVLLGAQAKDSIHVNELAGWCHTIPWEILTSITYRVPRIYRGGQAS